MGSSRAVSSPSAAQVDAKKTRAKHACRECHSRRVRCDVTEKQPCSNCAASGASCQVLPSRRGRYPRRSRRLQQSSESLETTPSLMGGHIGGGGDVTDHDPASESAASLSLETPSRNSISHADVQQDNNGDGDGISAQERRQEEERQARGATPTPSSAPAAGTLFFGESNFLTLVPRDDGIVAKTSASGGSHKPRLMFPIPATPESAGMSAGTMRYLIDEGALTLPDPQSCLPALQAYFTWFHPSYPILDRAEVTRRIASMDISPMLMQAMLFIGATYCDDETITAMGFQDRSQAKTTLYTRARVLFHADWEKDGIVLIQSLFLMSFWRGGHADVRDIRYWLGVVITFAESYGLHRSTRSIPKDSHQARIRRRIWWSIYRRERQAAASLGLPNRIRDEDCDVQPLTPSDLESEITYDSPFGTYHPEHITYAIKMVEIAGLLGRIIDLHFVPGRSACTESQIQDLNTALEAWREDLPENMKCTTEEASDSVWTCLLHLSFNQLRILVHRNSFLRQEGSKGSEVVLKAACRISRIAEDMSTQGTLRYGQMHLISSIFTALCIHTISIRRGTGVSRRIAEHRAEACLLCLKEVQKYWRINNNVLDLFLRYLDRSIAARLNGSQPEGETGGDADKSDLATGVQDVQLSSPSQVEAIKDASILGQAQARIQDNLFEEQYFNLVNGHWEGNNAPGDLGLFLQAEDLSQAGGGLNFLGRSL